MAGPRRARRSSSPVPRARSAAIVCQIARIKGCRVVASAGSKAKIDWLKNEAKVDVAIDYRATPDLPKALAAACPDGIDIYFDNVGGEHLEAAIGHMRMHGRIVMCGSISRYNDDEPKPGPNNLFLTVTRRLTMRGLHRHRSLGPDAAIPRRDGPLGAEGRMHGRRPWSMVWRDARCLRRPFSRRQSRQDAGAPAGVARVNRESRSGQREISGHPAPSFGRRLTGRGRRVPDSGRSRCP